MKILQTLFLYLFFAFLSIATSYAQIDPLQGDNLTSTPNTTTEVKAIFTEKDPKLAFKNLVEVQLYSKDGMKGINTEHLNPQAYSFVQDYMNKHADNLYDLQNWAKPYFDMMDDVLMQNGIPKELKYLAVIESNLRSSAVSWAGAVGPWQFMPQTAKEWGLNVSRFTDDRRNYLKSTWAASRYLNYLYDIYEDWMLVIAAYNCGPGRVNSAIKKAGSSNFWNLQYFLPSESRNHVKKFIATHYIMEGKGGITILPKQADYKPTFAKKVDITNVKVQTISGRYNSKAIAKHLGMAYEEFAALNPTLDRTLALNQTYQLRLPSDKIQLFAEKKNEMLNESLQLLLNPDYKL